MSIEPREPNEIAQQIIEDDSSEIEELLKGTEVEDEDYDEEDFEFDIPLDDQVGTQDDDIEYF